MAQVRICDRCGKRIKAYKTDSMYTLMRNDDTTHTAIAMRNFDDSFVHKVAMDLCKECQESLDMWVAAPTSPYGGD